MNDLSEKELFCLYQALDSFNPSGVSSKEMVISLMLKCSEELVKLDSVLSKYIV